MGAMGPSAVRTWFAALLLMDERWTAHVQRCRLGYLNYLIAPGGYVFGWGGVGFVFLAFFVFGSKATFLLACTGGAVGQTTCRVAKLLFQRKRPQPPDDIPRLVPLKVPGVDEPD